MRVFVVFICTFFSLFFLSIPSNTVENKSTNENQGQNRVYFAKSPKEANNVFLEEYYVNLATENAESGYTDDDLFCLAAVICCEAGGDSEKAQLLVANVVINRVNHPKKYSDTIREVLTEPYQYGSMWKDGIKFPKWAREETIEKCYDIAKRLLEGERVCPENVIYQARFTQGSGIYAEIDGEYFCYE